VTEHDKTIRLRASALGWMRVRILLGLRSGRAVTRAQIANELHAATPTVAYHLRVLVEAGFVREAAPPRKLPRRGTAPGRHELTDVGRAVLEALER
jgi:predicted ArsR family transcriptional regulator